MACVCALVCVAGCAGWSAVPALSAVQRLRPLRASGAPKRRRRKKNVEKKEITQEVDEIPVQDVVAALETTRVVEEKEDELLSAAAPLEEEEATADAAPAPPTPVLATATTPKEETLEAVPPPPPPEQEQPKKKTRTPEPRTIRVTMTEPKKKKLDDLALELPKPSEGRVNKLASAKGTAMGLPTLQNVEDRSRERKKRKKEPALLKGRQIEAGDREAYLRALELDPQADADPDLFKKPDVDVFANSLGENAAKFFGIDSAYLQIGHVALVLTLVLAAFVYEPNFPLTAAPVEYRDFLKQGLAVIYFINVAVAVLAFQEAGSRGQPRVFWALKSLLIGGVALNQLRTGTKDNNSR